MRIVIISDTHGAHDSLNLPDGDALIHCGDACMANDFKEAHSFAEWMEDQNYKLKIYVPGNHDFQFKNQLPLYKEQMKSVKILVDEGYEHDFIYFYGCPWVPLGQSWAYSYHKQSNRVPSRVFGKIPERTDILITHGPPKGIMDYALNRNLGSKHLEAELKRIQPYYHFFGHIHEEQGDRIKYIPEYNCVFANASNLDENYAKESIRDPLVIDVKL